MMVETVLSRSVRLICAGGLVLGMHAAQAQSAPETIQRVEITGSSIKRIAAEASLPVQSFSQKDIQRSGVTSVTDFIQQLPVMQGFTMAADSVGGGGGGITTASIHDVGEQYTLVLLNGRRMAPATSGTTIDINSIPLSAVERIEVLTDGASALYGADAIAGVVNFILKKGAAPLQIDVKYSKPQSPGAKDRTVSISKGFGDIDEDGYSVFLAASHQENERLKGFQRDFAKTGIINFNDPVTGKPLQFFNGSSRSIPPNVTIRYNPTVGKATSVSINPYLKINGKCPARHVDTGDGQCTFDYTSSVEIAPEIQRDSFYGSGSIKLGNSGFKAFTDISLNNSHVYANIAAYPAEFSLAKSSPLFGKYVAPYLTAEQLAGMTSATVKYRLQDLGGRAYDYQSKTTHIVAGLDGNAFGWDINGAFTYSENKAPTNYVGGFPLADKFNAALESGAVDPFPYALGEMPSAMKDALKGTQYVGNFSNTEIKMKGFDVHGSHDLFTLPAGKSQIAVGADYRSSSYSEKGNAAVSHSEILFDDDQPAFDYKRSNSGAFTEVLVPVIKGLEVTGSLRYDRVSKLTDNLKGGNTGNDQSASTYKIHTRYQPIKSLVLRAAYGTGFKAASMKEIGQPQADFGVTGGTYNCPLSTANGLANHPLAQFCDTRGQLEVYKGGNPDLKPEKSKQYSFGMVFEPTNSFSAKLDYWNVEIRDAVTSVSESLIASDPNKYLSLYTTKTKASTGIKSLAIILAPINIGRQENQGIDYDLLFRNKVGEGKLTARLAGTYMLKSRYTTPGTSDKWETSLNEYGSNDKVSFRNVLKASGTYEIGAFTSTLTANYRNGYKDKHHDIENCAVNTNDAAQDCVDVQLQIPSYTTLDFQTQYKVLKNLELTAGINNLADRTPPLSLRNTGSHQLGYDPRYASAVGRTFYLSGSYKF
ncbi:TonB-dependent receptor domain-containing protein [Rugamonas rubra]|uniref:Iron complex outermembrane recepter protein n=1 Tax=Rugamonas rubra TaxID=758825 RepID=A0A1I4M7C7_9BURK|nr:TonB-dependent receptor [Rugamonas rubra]SFL98877.1 iron complex outermembrane recepter protein [Rugamonas rubra]